MNRILPAAAVLGALAALGASTALAAPIRYEIRPGAGSEVRFLSKATMESFEGKTDRVTGAITFDPERLADSVTVRVEVDLASLDTGIGLRNRHMRENHLETGTYPTAVFTGGVVSKASAGALPRGGKAEFRMAGTFSLHGVERALVVPVTVERAEAGAGAGAGDRLHIRARFPVSLEEYGIDRPQFLVMKLADRQEVTVELTAVPAP